MNIYAEVIINEAKQRGIDVEIMDEKENFFSLNHNGNSILCWESLSEKTPAIAYTICSDKRRTHQVLWKAGFHVPRYHTFENMNDAAVFMAECGRVVVKPAVGEQGQGITVDLSDERALKAAVVKARKYHDEVFLEEYVEGNDLRIIVIDHEYVAAIERVPPTITGDGKHMAKELVQMRNDELMEMTNGESQIPVDNETERCIELGGYLWNQILREGAEVQARKTANYHTGGTIRDVTEEVSEALRQVAEDASRALRIPVVGFDFCTPDFGGENYVILEANERPGLANHEPQPVPQKFVDFLFPETTDPDFEQASGTEQRQAMNVHF